MTRPILRWVLVPLLAALGLQVVAAIRLEPLPALRSAVVAAAVFGMLLGLGMGASGFLRLVARVLAAPLVAGLFWLGTLEVWLSLDTPFVVGLLFLGAAFLAHATLTFARLAPRDAESVFERLLLRLGLLVTVVAVLLFAIEAGFRLAIPVNVYEIDPDGLGGDPCFSEAEDGTLYATPGFRGKYLHPQFPGVRVAINDYGLRDGLDEAVPKAAGECSILVLGDSFAFGTGVELDETFQERLEARAAEISDRPLRVFCAAMPGDSQYQGVVRLDALADRARPDVVIAAVYEGNDLEDNMRCGARERGLLPSKEELDERKEESDRAFGPALLRFARGVAGIEYWLGSSSTLQYLLPSLEPRLVALGLIPKLVPTNLFLNETLAREPPTHVHIGLAYTRYLLERIRDRCVELGAELVVLVIPAAVQADPARFEDLLSRYPSSERGSLDRTLFHTRLVATLRERGLRVVDMLGPLEREAEQGRRAYHDEGHWNVRGHEIAADALVPVLRELLAVSR